MPNIRAQRMDGNGIYVMLSDGTEISITPAQIRARFVAESGGLAARRLRVRQWIRDQIFSARPELLSAVDHDIDTDFDDADGRPSVLSIGRRANLG